MRNYVVNSVAALMLAAPLLLGCGGGGQSPESVASAFINAKTQEEAKPHVTSLAWEKMSAMGEDREKNWQDNMYSDVTFGETTITGDTASVAMTGEDGTGNILLRQEGGAWKVYGLQAETPLGNMTIDFEHPENMLQGISEGMGKAMGDAMGEAMQGMTDEMKKALEENMKQHMPK